MEVRLNKRQKIKQLFGKLNINAPLTFKKLFKPAISRKVLTYYLDELTSCRPALLDFKTSDDKALLAQLICNNPELPPKQIMHVFGLRKALELHTLRELRVMFARQSQRSWYRLMADIKKISLPSAPAAFGVIQEHLDKFKPLTLAKH